MVDDKKLIEKEMVSAVSYSKNESKITISGIPDKPGISAQIFGLLSDKNINVDMIVQNISQDGINANITFTVPNNDLNNAKTILENNLNEINYVSLKTDENVSKISVIGMGMMSQSGVAQKMFKTLANNSINILAISTSEIKISVLINEKYTKIAVKSLEAYKLGNNMESVGKYLKSKENLKGIPLGLIAKELKISSSILSKIETDQIELDKDAIFYIGHVRSYCNYLELETDIIVQQFKFQISYNKNEVVQNIAKPKFQKDYLNYRFFLPVSSILIILSTFYFLFVYNKDDERQYALILIYPKTMFL